MNVKEGLKLKGVWKIDFYDNGIHRKTICEKNLVVNEGINFIFSNDLEAGSQYMGLTDGTPSFAAGDTLASHAGWTEVTAYTGDRKLWDKTLTAVTLTNSGSTASFTGFTGTGTIGGLFLATVSTGTAGSLISGVAFTDGDQSFTSATTVAATYILSGSSS